jgi:hypothetical protein
MRRCFALAVARLMLLNGKAAAGWYRVDNYVGFLGPDPIHFSTQPYASFESGIMENLIIRSCQCTYGAPTAQEL